MRPTSMLKMPVRLLAWTWAGPGTLIGLVAATLARVTGGHTQCRHGAIEAYGGAVRILLSLLGGRPRGVLAMALGHVILTRDAGSLESWRAHEHVHVRQWERWGILFPFAYLGASLWAWLRGRDPYLANRFEREAYGWPDAKDRTLGRVGRP